MIANATRARRNGRNRQTLPNGFVFYRGPSMIDSKPIIAIATGLVRMSENPKTGPMIQTYILRSDIHPTDAVHAGDDISICGDCPLRGIIELKNGKTRNRFRACYVDHGQAPSQVWRTFQNGGYPDFEPVRHLAFIRGRGLRAGSYGDPTAVPLANWLPLFRVSKMHTGYTHQWRIGKFWRWRKWIMASCETLAHELEANQRGWRAFTTAETDDGGAWCDASPDGGYRAQCITCGKCNGSRGQSDERPNIRIRPHGGNNRMGAWNRIKWGLPIVE